MVYLIMSLNNTLKCFIIWFFLWALVQQCTECRTLSLQVSSGMQPQTLVTSESDKLIRIKRVIDVYKKCAKESTRIGGICIETMKIQISEDLKRALDKTGKFITTPRGVVDVKGKGEMMTYWLDGRTGPSPVRPATSLDCTPSFLARIHQGRTSPRYHDRNY